ncbi:Hypothetical protein CAP_7728 [Chondromyces apiculatus DSM 436]|uniref:Carboxypeptidase regulatory-like domain-containing protein n=2 Tax=Chondromyces apiculatus TaxID=51 RepID=A0A017SYJ1_9BACT|nr:Hypothetical protein CAP_7728 [Chondromyces apiculatus DSM 436]
MVLAAALLGVACDPAFNFSGTIKSPSGALAGAEVTLFCPSYEPIRLTSSAQGYVGYHQIPGQSPECRVTVSKPGFRPHEVTLDAICTGHFGLSCTRAQLDVQLAPAE